MSGFLFVLLFLLALFCVGGAPYVLGGILAGSYRSMPKWCGALVSALTALLPFVALTVYTSVTNPDAFYDRGKLDVLPILTIFAASPYLMALPIGWIGFHRRRRADEEDEMIRGA
ncbi:hypothetical protein [Aurantiacibacter gilvus]|uniref:Uncharacterized protein n=1 Tax=Aurantiacibacter gilvus TaxID=3139141 RepID=A0ABU9IDP1_9SPHN